MNYSIKFLGQSSCGQIQFCRDLSAKQCEGWGGRNVNISAVFDLNKNFPLPVAEVHTTSSTPRVKVSIITAIMCAIDQFDMGGTQPAPDGKLKVFLSFRRNGQLRRSAVHHLWDPEGKLSPIRAASTTASDQCVLMGDNTHFFGGRCGNLCGEAGWAAPSAAFSFVVSPT